MLNPVTPGVRTAQTDAADGGDLGGFAEELMYFFGTVFGGVQEAGIYLGSLPFRISRSAHR